MYIHEMVPQGCKKKWDNEGTVREMDSQGGLQGGGRTWNWSMNHSEVSQGGQRTLKIGSRNGVHVKDLG